MGTALIEKALIFLEVLPSSFQLLTALGPHGLAPMVVALVSFLVQLLLLHLLDQLLFLPQGRFDGVNFEGLITVVLVEVLYICLDFLLDVF